MQEFGTCTVCAVSLSILGSEVLPGGAHACLGLICIPGAQSSVRKRLGKRLCSERLQEAPAPCAPGLRAHATCPPGSSLSCPQALAQVGFLRKCSPCLLRGPKPAPGSSEGSKEVSLPGSKASLPPLSCRSILWVCNLPSFTLSARPSSGLLDLPQLDRSSRDTEAMSVTAAFPPLLHITGAQLTLID